jgi:hypothetical protein
MQPISFFDTSDYNYDVAQTPPGSRQVGADTRFAMSYTPLRPNPAQRLYTRLGFRAVEETSTHIYMEAR